MKCNIFFVLVTISLLIFSCKEKEDSLFELLDDKKTGITFSNDLKISLEKNIFNYLYFYNGAGVGAGDFNNDGMVDLFFAGNQVPNELYLNKGNLKFEEVALKANILYDSTWHTGVSVVDINNDGMLDIYVSTVSKIIGLQGQNKFYICKKIDENGIPFYEDEAVLMGLDSSGYGTQAVFFDYDMDGDLDLFQLNHSTHKNNTFGQRNTFEGTVNDVAGDRLYRNDNGFFVDVSEESGIHRSSIGYGLGIVVSDINMDGLPDIYIGNDFHENDYYYINNGDGTFTESLTDQMMHTSRFSMGVDAADINQDGFPDVISLDMLPEDPYILKRSESEDALDIFNFKLGYGYNHQYAKNALQLNNRNGTFSEVAAYAGVLATDWSWASLFIDFDNDGFKDLFITNGIPKRMNDIDYINFVSQSDVQWKIRMDNMEEADLDLINKLPEVKISNKFFRNQTKDIKFEDIKKKIKNNKISYSNGAIAVDLDNDGDLDIVTNNIDDKAFLYENKTCNKEKCSLESIEIKLKGPSKNINALGAKMLVFSKNGLTNIEKFPVRGFLSSMEVPLLASKDVIMNADSIFLVWPDNSYQKLDKKYDYKSTIVYQKDLPKFDYNLVHHYSRPKVHLEDKTAISNLKFTHSENPFIEFNRESLIPQAVSNEGPAIAVGDVNGDGLEDIFFGNAKWKEAEVWFQQSNGKFIKTTQPSISLDSTYEDVDAVFVDINGDSHLDLVVGSGGNEYSIGSEFLLSRVYINDGKGNFTKNPIAIKDVFSTVSCVLPHDFNGDGHIDLFLGSRAVPWKYGEIPKSYFLQNDGKGNFTDVTSKMMDDNGLLGFVTGGQWVDMNGDGQKDLVLSLQWEQVAILYHKKGRLVKNSIGDVKGWWNFVHVIDIDGDGDLDIVAGNYGLNSRLKASKKEPITMYYDDFDQNDTKEQILTYYIDGKEILFANIVEIHKQLPYLKKKFLKAEDFAKASFNDIFPKKQLEKSKIFKSDYFENCVFINDGSGNFSPIALPPKAQMSSFRTAISKDINGDNLPDLLLGGNFYENNVQVGRIDGDFGCVLINKGNGQFEYAAHSGVQIKGQIRNLTKIMMGNEENVLVGRNNDTSILVNFSKSKK